MAWRNNFRGACQRNLCSQRHAQWSTKLFNTINGCEFRWNNSPARWEFFKVESATLYSTSDVATPDLAADWKYIAGDALESDFSVTAETGGSLTAPPAIVTGPPAASPTTPGAIHSPPTASPAMPYPVHSGGTGQAMRYQRPASAEDVVLLPVPGTTPAEWTSDGLALPLELGQWYKLHDDGGTNEWVLTIYVDNSYSNQRNSTTQAPTPDLSTWPAGITVTRVLIVPTPPVITP